MLKKLNRELTTREKFLLLILALIMIGAAYYFYVYEPSISQIKRLEQKQADLELEITEDEVKMEEIQKMKKEMDSIVEGTPEYTYMPSYNYEKQEISYLQDILTASTKEYHINFSKISRDKDQLRRKFSLSFTVSGYEDAKKIIKELEGSDIRCIIGDMSVGFDKSGKGDNEVDKDLFEKDITIDCSATFYETVYDAVEDLELPADGKSK